MNNKALALLLPGLGALALVVGIVAHARRAHAAPGIHTPASICRPKNYTQGADFHYASGAIIQNESTSGKSINCAVMADVSGLGTLEVRLVGVDNSTTGSVSCTFVTTNSQNVQVWQSAPINSFPTAAQTGAFNTSVATGPVNDHDFYRHYINCSIPGKVGNARSALYGIRVF